MKLRDLSKDFMNLNKSFSLTFNFSLLAFSLIIALFFLSNIFSSPVSAEDLMPVPQGPSPEVGNSTLTHPPISATTELNDTMPNFKIPELQIKIPGVNFTELANLNCAKDGKTGKITSCGIPWIGEYIAGVYKYAIGIVGILAAVVLMVGGVLWIIAGGNATTIGEAKAWIGASLTGLVIALCSYTILYQINPDLLKFKPLTIGVVQKMDIEPKDIQFTSGGGLNTINSNNTTFDSFLRTAATTNNIECNLLKSFMLTESSGNPNAKSEAGAIGLMQLMPKTAQGLGYNTDSLKDPQTNINAGAKYLKQLKQTACNGKTSNRICDSSINKYFYASYNGGPGANRESTICPGKTYWECKNNTGYAETRKYVEKIQGNYEKIKDKGWDC